jgi:uncharacterized protein
VTITVRDDPERNRYELLEGGTLAGVEDYKLAGDHIALVHTEVDPAHSGTGLAAQLVAHVLDDARRRHLAVLPYCSYVRNFIDDNSDTYLGLVPESRRGEFGWGD